MQEKKIGIGNPDDLRCRQGRFAIDRKICRNNCKYWKKYCKLGY